MKYLKPYNLYTETIKTDIKDFVPITYCYIGISTEPKLLDNIKKNGIDLRQINNGIGIDINFYRYIDDAYSHARTISTNNYRPLILRLEIKDDLYPLIDSDKSSNNFIEYTTNVIITSSRLSVKRGNNYVELVKY